MARQIIYTDRHGVVHPTAYAQIQLGELKKQAKRTRAELFIYHDAATAGTSEPLSPIESYLVEDDEFDIWFAPAVLQADGVDPWAQWYTYLKEPGRVLEVGTDV